MNDFCSPKIHSNEVKFFLGILIPTVLSQIKLRNLNMKKINKIFRKLALTTVILTIVTSSVNAQTTTSESTTELLSTSFEPRNVVKIEVGDFHFVPSQIGPIHVHVAPAVGYVAKGEIIYQVEGRKPVFLREGDAFFEPAGPRILRFDNASATEEAVFIDLNLEQKDEPFIVFEKELTTHIDRRTLPTLELDGKSMEKVNVFISEINPGGLKDLKVEATMIGYVAEGIITIKGKDGIQKRFISGSTFPIPRGEKQSLTVKNESSEVPAKIVSFYMH